jgi:putative sterol carrier protein
MRFTGEGGGDWTVRVKDGQGSVTEESAANPDMVFTQTPEAFELLRQGKLDPVQAMQSGSMEVDGIDRMPEWSAVFAPPPLDKVLPAMGEVRPS